MSNKEKIKVVADILRDGVQYVGNREPNYTGPYYDFVEDICSIDVFSEKDKAFYWAEKVTVIAKAMSLSFYMNFDPDTNRVFAHIYT